MTLVTAELVFAQDRFERRHGFVVQGGRILATGVPGDLATAFPDHDREDWGNVAILPGCVNGHAHAVRAALRGRGDDLTPAARRRGVLEPFLESLDADGIRSGVRSDLTQMLRHGVTTTVECFPLHDRGNQNDLAVIDAADDVGLRIVLARAMSDRVDAPRRTLESPEEAARNVRELAEAIRGATTAFAHPAPGSIEDASPEMIQAAAGLAEELDVLFHIHVASSRDERDRSIERHGLSPIGFLDSLGALSARTALVDCVWVDQEDLAVIAERGASIVHQPSANALRGEGIAPLREMLARRLPVCLGIGGADANGRRSVFDEMRTAALLAKAVESRADAVHADDVLLAGTARGGEILGLPVGRIAADHAADLVVLDLEHPSLRPPATAEKQIVYALEPDAITRVMVSGRTVVEHGELLHAGLDEASGVADPALAGRPARD